MNSVLKAGAIVGICYLVAPAFTFAVSVGLLLGWNVLEQPAIVKTYFDKASAWVKAKFSK